MKCCRKDCFAWNPHLENNCNALSDNLFGGRSCPFYKNYQVEAEERERIKRRNKEGKP